MLSDYVKINYSNIIGDFTQPHLASKSQSTVANT
ncbi:MAG: hypothetical protein MRECE_61c005 [Mycoplasmataceae bacterium CE_OT135]|nr:MAG: hypothetical protein MRECE_61c005 [Mycoplasmataceae bacterium CE_OT135]